MKIIQCLMCFLACSLQAQSIGEVLLVQRFQPNKTYIQQTAQVTKMQVHILKMPKGADAAAPEKMNSLVTMNARQEMTTGDRNNRGEVVYTAGFEQKMAIKVNGEPQKLPGQAADMHFSYRGRLDSLGAVTLDSVLQGPGELQALKATINNLSKNMQLPNKRVKVGSWVSQEVPFNMDQFSGKLMMRYHLDSITGNKAYFTLDQNMDLDMVNGALTMKGKAKGPGKMTFLIREQMVDSMSSELTMQMRSNIGEMEMELYGKTELSVNNAMK
jgi:hypothetical protein